MRNEDAGAATETVLDEKGEPLRLEDARMDEEQLARRLPRWTVRPAPLPQEDSGVAPEAFRAEIRRYLKEILRLRAADFAVDFAASGAIRGVSYWVFRCEPTEGLSLYVIAGRDGHSTSLACVETTIDYFDDEKQVHYDLLLSPEQAMLYDFLQADSEAD